MLTVYSVCNALMHVFVRYVFVFSSIFRIICELASHSNDTYVHSARTPRKYLKFECSAVWSVSFRFVTCALFIIATDCTYSLHYNNSVEDTQYICIGKVHLLQQQQNAQNQLNYKIPNDDTTSHFASRVPNIYRIVDY